MKIIKRKDLPQTDPLNIDHLSTKVILLFSHGLSFETDRIVSLIDEDYQVKRFATN